MTTRQTIGRLFEPISVGKEKTTYIRYLTTVSSWYIFDIIGIILIGLIINDIQANDFVNVSQVGLIYSGILALYYITKRYARNKTWVNFVGYVHPTIRKYILQRYIKLDFTYTEKYGTGRGISIIQDGFTDWKDTLEVLAYFIPNLVIKLLFLTYMLYNIGRIYLLIFIGLFVVTVSIIFISNKDAQQVRANRADNKIQQSRAIVRMLMTKQEILHNNQFDGEIHRLKELYKESFIFQKLLQKKIWLMFNSGALLGHILYIMLFVYGYIGIKQGNLNLGLVGSFAATIGVITSLMLEFVNKFKDLSDKQTNIEKLWDFLDGGKNIGHQGTQSFINNGGDITFTDIGFAYDETDKVFVDLSFIIKGGQKTALVGPSGGGKSTLIKLIAGYIRPDDGIILIGGQDLQDISLQSYYPHIGYLTQEPSVFDGTVWENLTYGMPEDLEKGEKLENLDEKANSSNSTTSSNSSLEDRIKTIIRLSRCEFVHEFKNGLQTEIGEKGVRLSGGQRQRLAIAKIMLKDPDIILLDEPTSALDSENEELVTQALNELFRGKTVIVIAHRLQTVKHADQILYIDDGQIIESGTHQELLDLGAKYATMVELQSGF